MVDIIAAVKGTRDYYPEDMAVRSWLYKKMREVAESFGYQEYEGPILEKIDLYAAKSGEELVKEQAYVFPDRSGELITLRPELTPTLARMVAQRQRQMSLPLRWWSFGPFWRYERPQKGRTREFFQWNVDLIGANSPESDAELVAVGAAFFKKVGLAPENVGIYFNDRRLMESTLEKINLKDEEGKKQVFRLIDRRDKLTEEAWDAYAKEIGLNPDQLSTIKRMLDNKDLWQGSPSVKRFNSVLEAHGVGEYVQYDPQIVRGLDYYTGIVFEARDKDHDSRAIFGGGHYDNLVADVGGDPLPGVGFAMGDVMASIVLRKYSCLPDLSQSPAQVLVTVFEESLMLPMQELAAHLRDNGMNVICYSEADKLQRQLRTADRLGIQLAVIVGPEENAAGQVTIKDLKSREQQTLPKEQAVRALKQMLAG